MRSAQTRTKMRGNTQKKTEKISGAGERTGGEDKTNNDVVRKINKYKKV